MAVLTNEQRQELWATYMSSVSGDGEAVGAFNKNELRTALDAVDDWVNTNQASFNAALPEPFQSEATASQKARLLTGVVGKRFIEGVV
jgi:hypothetical protein